MKPFALNLQTERQVLGPEVDSPDPALVVSGVDLTTAGDQALAPCIVDCSLDASQVHAGQPSQVEQSSRWRHDRHTLQLTDMVLGQRHDVVDVGRQPSGPMDTVTGVDDVDVVQDETWDVPPCQGGGVGQRRAVTGIEHCSEEGLGSCGWRSV